MNDPHAMNERLAFLLQRYRAIIPDVAAFQEALAQRPARFLRANSQRLAAAELRARFEASGYAITPLGWSADAFRVEGLTRPGATLEYLLGLFHLQGASSMLPVLALDVQPGHRVLDMCAAPGSKTTQIGTALRGSGFVLANDVSRGRLVSLSTQVGRLGHATIALANVSGDAFPSGLLFDRVLADVPCSAEGRIRAGATQPRDGQVHNADLHYLVAKQRRLLRRAVNLVRPGGLVVYSTCTYNPDENEAAIDELLRARPDVRLEPLPAALPAAPGLTRWGEVEFLPQLALCGRFYPHLSDGDTGFFVARLRKDPNARQQPISALPDPVPEAKLRAATLGYFEDRFGVPQEVFEDLHLHESAGDVWAIHKSAPAPQSLGPWRGHNVGLRLLRDPFTHPKPTSYALMWLGDHLRNAVVELEPAQLWRFLAGDHADVVRGEATDGYVVVRIADQVLGCASLRGTSMLSRLRKSTVRAIDDVLFRRGAYPRYPVESG